MLPGRCARGEFIKREEDCGRLTPGQKADFRVRARFAFISNAAPRMKSPSKGNGVSLIPA